MRAIAVGRHQTTSLFVDSCPVFAGMFRDRMLITAPNCRRHFLRLFFILLLQNLFSINSIWPIVKVEEPRVTLLEAFDLCNHFGWSFLTKVSVNCSRSLRLSCSRLFLRSISACEIFPKFSTNTSISFCQTPVIVWSAAKFVYLPCPFFLPSFQRPEKSRAFFWSISTP